MADELDLDPPGLLRLAGRMTDVAEVLTGVERPPVDRLPAGSDGPPPAALADLWLDELSRVALDLRDLAATITAVAQSVAAVDERLAARLARLGTDPADER